MRFVLCLWFVFSATEGARILGYFPIPSISHQIIFQPIWKELSLRGHEVTVITTDPLSDKSLKNLTEINVHFTYEVVDGVVNKVRPDKGGSPLKTLLLFHEAMRNAIRDQVHEPDFQKILKYDRDHFDLILIEAHCHTAYGLGGLFDAPIILVSSLEVSPYIHDFMGNPTHPSLYPDSRTGLSLGNNLTFKQKWLSFISEIVVRVVTKMNLIPEANKLAKELFGKNIPDIEDIQKNISMIFLNVNPLVFAPRPTVPAVLQFSQMNIKPKKPLPKDLQCILDSSKNGVAYFSLGSNMKSVNMKKRLLQNIIAALEQLPYTVIWKWESDELPGKPKNVVTRKWLPQQDILGHPNVKVFVTQGGMQSIEEAMYNGVPLVGMPFFMDQPGNVKKLEEMGVALGIDPETATAEQIRDTIMEVAQNPKYKSKILEASDILKDQPMTGLEKAVWWSEYVIRHKGAKHLRSPLLNIPWYQYWLLDVLAATILVIFLILYVTFKSLRFILYKLRRFKLKND